MEAPSPRASPREAGPGTYLNQGACRKTKLAGGCAAQRDGGKDQHLDGFPPPFIGIAIRIGIGIGPVRTLLTDLIINRIPEPAPSFPT